MDANPLNGVFLDEPIHTSINQHFQYFPLDQDLFHDNAYKAYHLQFVLGLLTSIVSPRGGNIFVRPMDNNLRIFVIEPEKVRFHNIFYEHIIDEKTNRPMITPNEFYSIKKIAENLNLGMSELVTVENYLYGLKKPQENDGKAAAILKLLDLNDLTIFQIYKMPSEERLENNLVELNSPHGSLIELHRIPSHEDLFSLINNKRNKFSMAHLKVITEYLYPKMSLDHFPQNGPLGRAGYMQGFFFKSIPHSYYTTLYQSPLPVISYSDGVLSMCLPSTFEPNHYAMFNFGQKNQAAHRLLFGPKNEDLVIRQVNIDTDSTNEYKETDPRKVKFALESILYYMEHDIIKAKDISQVQEYHKTIWEYLKCLGISEMRRESLNAFLFGMLRTATDLETFVAYKPNGNKFSIEALLLKHGKSRYLLTVDATRENHPNLGSLHTFSNKKNEILHLNIAVSGGQLEISTSATSLQEAALIYDFEECGGFHIKNALQQALENNNVEQVGHLKKNLEQAFHNLLGESTHISEIETDLESYLSGLLAHFKSSQYHEIPPTKLSHGMATLIQIQVTGQKHGVLIYIIAPTAEKNIAEIITDFGAFDETHSLSIAYDLEAKQIALFGLDPKTAKLDTENVESVCQRGSRRKRGSSSACSFLYNEEEDQMKINDKIIKETIETKNLALKEHLSLIYELTGKIQMGFLARDFVGDLVQGDTKALLRDGFFFGGNLLAQKVGSMAAMYGAKVASKALSRSIVSFGLCLPKLAFDGYMAYQMVQQISNKDTVGAVTTGAFLAIDMAECALQALVTFGLITLNPLVLPVMAIASTLLLIGINVYDAMKKVKEIDHIVHLSSEEYTYEFIREFFHAGTDAYIQHVMDEKQANEYIVSKLFENYPNIKRFLVSAAIMKEDKSTSFIDDNEIDLSKKHTFWERSRAMPEVTKSQSIFCVMSEEPHEKFIFQKIVDYALYSNVWYTLTLLFNRKTSQQFRDFYCHNAYGVSMLNASHSEKTMFLLFDGNDNVTGFQYASNIFQIGNGSKLILGGDHDDYFKLTGSKMTGSLDSAGGYDTLDLSEYGSKKLLSIRGNVVMLLQGGEAFSLKNIENIIGRQNLSDIIYVCNENRIDLAGSFNYPDEIFIDEDEDHKCPPPTNLTIYLRKDTHVSCSAKAAKVTYLVKEDSRGIVKAEKGSHHFYFKGLKITDLDIVDLKGTNLSLIFSRKRSQLKIIDLSNVSLEFEDHIQMKPLNGSLMAYLETPESAFEIIEKYSQFIEDSSLMTLVVNTSDGIIVMKHNHHSIRVNGVSKRLNIIVDNHKTDAHLVGHKKAENYFLLFKNVSEIGLKEIDLKVHTRGGVSHIDFYNLARLIHNSTNGEYGLNVLAEMSGKDVKLKLQAMPNKAAGTATSLGKVTLINGIKFMKWINIHIYGTNVLKLINGKVVIQSLAIKTNETVMVVLPGQLDFHSTIFIEKVANNLEPYFLNKTLMLTNAASSTFTSEGYTTILFSDFSIYKGKYRTIQLEFVDKKMQLKDFFALSSLDEMKMNKFWMKSARTI